MATDLFEKLVSLCKRRGFVFQSSEIYGGVGGVYDYGPLGVELKRHIRDAWWTAMTQLRDDIEGLDAAILMHPRVWEASGHVEGFHDPLVDCRQCKGRFRADKLLEEFAERLERKHKRREAEALLHELHQKDAPLGALIARYAVPCPTCGARDWTDVRQFNLMFKTFLGPVEDSASLLYLRPETAQGIYVNFHNVKDTTRQKIPFGIAQIGKAFRNEIVARQFIFRMREFEQMEMQFFVRPGTDEAWFRYWIEERYRWHLSLGIRSERLRLHEHGPDELAHYAKAAVDIQYRFPIGWQEVEGIHNRTDFDLSRHQQYSGKNLKYFDPETQTSYIPYVVETSAGLDRTLLMVLADAYDEEPVEGETRVVLRLHPKLAPIKVAVLPLVNRDGMPERAEAIYRALRRRFRTFYDDKGAIGRRYRRMDEIGTPFAVTIDSQTLEDGTVTVRDRDTMRQERVCEHRLTDYLQERLERWEREHVG
ncbi:MAG: glycine--tRNA ligase [Bacteroidota bacterium]|nr:glycine--tRNA ligase [Bacteroidota bacterium]MDW8136838.1 glycine--tRNA ligase [Bacteroidota bacterium]